jgi:hypothetical protein
LCGYYEFHPSLPHEIVGCRIGGTQALHAIVISVDSKRAAADIAPNPHTQQLKSNFGSNHAFNV